MVYSLTMAEAQDVLRMMTLIRGIELEISKRYSDGKMRCPTHLSVGQEATPAVLSLFLSKEDYAVSTHRSHAHFIAKGGDIAGMLAEIYGLDQGCSKGRGGSMHLADKAVGFMGSSAIVGNSIPVGTGLGHALKLDGVDAISVVYLGDAAVEEGVFAESINYAATKQLPVLFVCENNGYSVYSDMEPRQPLDRKIYEMVMGYGIESKTVSSFDFEALITTLRDSVNYCRAERRPLFVEIETARYLEHCGPNSDDHLNYRSRDMVSQQKALDPLAQLQSALKSEGIEVEQLEEEISSFVAESFKLVESLHHAAVEEFRA